MTLASMEGAGRRAAAAPAACAARRARGWRDRRRSPASTRSNSGMAAVLLAARVEQEAELRGGEQIVRARSGSGCGTRLRPRPAGPCAAAGSPVRGAVRGWPDRAPAPGGIRDERVAGGQQFARHFGGARFAAAGGGQQRGTGVVGAAHGLPDAAQIHQHGAPVGQQPPGAFRNARRPAPVRRAVRPAWPARSGR